MGIVGTLPLIVPLYVPGNPRGQPTERADFVSAAEFTVRAAIELCAPSVLLPVLPTGLRRIGALLRPSDLTASAQSRVRFVDRRESAWKAVRAYVLPIYRDALRDPNPFVLPCGLLANDLYLLALAAKWKCQVVCSIADLRSHVTFIRRNYRLRGESAARLSVISGMLELLEPSLSLPALRVAVGLEHSFRHRMAEILEDAYLNEASTFRRFLAFNSNAASVRRDLRRVLQSIIKNSKWAKGAVRLASDLAVLPSEAAAALDLLLSAVDDTVSGAGPVVVDVKRHWPRLHGGFDGAFWRPLRHIGDAQTVAWLWHLS